jgi:hypothetical protein
LLHDNKYTSHAYLQGDDDAVPPYGGAVNNIPIGKRPEGTYARIFRKEIERIDELPDPEYKTGLFMENAISIYL